MFQAWRWKLRAAEEALAQGRPLEAGQLLQQDGLLEFLPGRRLGERVAAHLAEQARRLMVHGESQAAWKAWEAAQTLVGESESLAAVRQELVAVAVRDAESQLAAGGSDAAAAILKSLAARGLATDDVAQLKEAQRRVDTARELAARGRFAEAAEQVSLALGVRPSLGGLEIQRAQYLETAQQVRQVSEQLHRALAGEQWTEVVALADSLLAIAPDMPLALEVRRRAWAKVGARVGGPRRFAETQHWTPSRAAGSAVRSGQESSMENGSDSLQAGSRFLMWVDAVGGFLVSLSPEVTLGQAVPGNHVNIPVLGDLSRQHARIRRQGDAYVIEPLADVRLRGLPITSPTPLRDGDELQLGDVVRLRFRQPHALSATARLDFVSRHRMPYAVDAILLLAESCVLGPRKSNHVICRDWSRDVILYRKDDQLYCRTMDSIEIDGQVVDGRGELTLNSRVAGEDFSLSLESL